MKLNSSLDEQVVETATDYTINYWKPQKFRPCGDLCNTMSGTWWCNFLFLKLQNIFNKGENAHFFHNYSYGYPLDLQLLIESTTVYFFLLEVQQAYMDFWCTCINTCASKVNNLVG
jgi:hypothetical protein